MLEANHMLMNQILYTYKSYYFSPKDHSSTLIDLFLALDSGIQVLIFTLI